MWLLCFITVHPGINSPGISDIRGTAVTEGPCVSGTLYWNLSKISK